MGLIHGGAQLLGKIIRHFKSQIQTDLAPNFNQTHNHIDVEFHSIYI
jgi:hypothetical protein